MKKIYIFILIFTMLVYNSIAQQVGLSGKVVNPDENPIKNVLVYLANNPTIFCRTDSLGNFTLTDEMSTSIIDVRQNEIISFENRNLSIYANNQSISVDIININGSTIKNILNMNKSVGTVSLYPEAYISDLPKAIYIVRARVGNAFKSFKIQNIVPSNLPQGITHYDIYNTIEKSSAEPRSITKSEAMDTLVLVHDFYKSRKIPLDSYSIQYDTIHLNNFADYSIAEGFEPSVTQLYNRNANFTDILSADSVQFIIDYDSISIFKGDLKVITIPVDKIDGLDNSIEFISGLHFEPSGTKFFQPVEVFVFMKDPLPENLVVFQYNDQGETYFIPHESNAISTGGHVITFIINHFSSIGIGTGEVHPPSGNPEDFTTSDQFNSYLDEYFRYCISIGKIDPPPMDFFAIWFNNVVAPMISSIITWEDFEAALSEFIMLLENYLRSGGVSSVHELSFWDFALEMLSEKMMNLWNACVVEYNGLEDMCLKRDVLDLALQILELNARLGEEICPDLSVSNFENLMNNFSNGEPLRLAHKIKFPTPVKHLEVGQSFLVQYALLNMVGDTALPEVVSWSSSNPSVASINSDGNVVASSEGTTMITGKICDIKNTFKVEVGGVNCEEYYCSEICDSCYSGTYKGTGVMEYYHFNHELRDPLHCYKGTSNKKWYTLTIHLGRPFVTDYHGLASYSTFTLTDSEEESCETHASFNQGHNPFPYSLRCDKIGYFRDNIREYEGTLSGGVLTVIVHYRTFYGEFTAKIICSRID